MIFHCLDCLEEWGRARRGSSLGDLGKDAPIRVASFARHGKPGFAVVRDDAIEDPSGNVATLRDALASCGVEGLRRRADAGGRRIRCASSTTR